jgi:hypothetical protein
MRRVRLRHTTAATALIACVAVSAATAANHTRGPIHPLYASWALGGCALLNKEFPHGVGMVNAQDLTKGRPVKNFLKSDRYYEEATMLNRKLDLDNDEIACEKA